MAIPQDVIDQIQGRVDIVEVISQYVPLKKVGRNYKAPCPFHNEKTPSFIVSPDKQIYHCFGCNAGGNVFSFLMKYENIQFPEAIEVLAEKAGVVLPRNISRSAESLYASQLYSANESACQFFESCLFNNKNARDYLISRGLSEETIKKFKIGYAPDSWDGLLSALKKKGIDGVMAEKAGLVISNDKGGYYDRFRGRITFPIIDMKSHILGFGARVMDGSLPKYINSPETPIYSKGRNLYGLNFSKDHIKSKGYALVVEGYLDFIVPFQAGIQNIIATLGTALTVDQIKLVKRFGKTVVMVYDPDEAGEAASLRNLDLFISEDVGVYIAELPVGYDPDSFIKKFGADDFIKLIKSSKNLFDYKLKKLEGRFDIKTSNGKARIAGEMLPTLARINNAVLRSELLKKLAVSLDVDEDSLKVEMGKVKTDYSDKTFSIKPIEVKRDFKVAEMILLALLLEGGSYIDKIMESLSSEDFRDSSIRDVFEVVRAMHKENIQIRPASLISRAGGNSETAVLISEAVNILESLDDKDRALNDCVARIKKDNFNDRLARLQEAIKFAHNQKDDDKVRVLVAEYNDLVKNIKN